MKNKQNNLNQENNNLKLQINSYDNFNNFNNNQILNRTMFNIQPQNDLNNNPLLLDNINNITNIHQRQNIFNDSVNDNNYFLKSNNNINNYLDIFSFSQFDENYDNEYNHKRTLNEFKKLLRKIDERLEAPLIENRAGNI